MPDDRWVKNSAAFSKGKLRTAFVFSVPGIEEELLERPAAGHTGRNLDDALAHLHAALPTMFGSKNRYDYTIANAFWRPLARSAGDARSEATAAEILQHQNVNRILSELHGCILVILSGKKAKLLRGQIEQNGTRTVIVPHVGNKGLNSSYKLDRSAGEVTSRQRRLQRIEQWAMDIIGQVEEASRWDGREPG